MYMHAAQAQTHDTTAFKKNSLIIKKEVRTYGFGSFNPVVKETPGFFHTISVIPENYYTQQLGIICRKELEIEKATKIPLRFRVGSLQQCNYLEGKR